MEDTAESLNPILNILVVGFHHKKGCQIEFSYPALDSSICEGNECPADWKYLPSLALPDGSHNYDQDSAFFNLPSLTDPDKSIYGVSCYRQIPVEQLKSRPADVTRSTVQKSVCALLTHPIYGYVEVKLSLIAHAFFEQGDFSSVSLLIRAYEQLNACLLSESSMPTQPKFLVNIGIPLRDMLLKFKHKLLILFKLLFLQKRIICFGSPVRPICDLILSIISLHPRLLEAGFSRVACVGTALDQIEEVVDKTPIIVPEQSPEIDSKLLSIETPIDLVADVKDTPEIEQYVTVDDSPNDFIEKSHIITETSGVPFKQDTKNTVKNERIVRETSVDMSAFDLLQFSSIGAKSWNAPVPVFDNNVLCFPYLSLSYMDLLTDESVKGYIIGASNILFQQKKQLFDVLIDIESGVIEVPDPELRRQLTLTTEDLRFVNHIMRNAQSPKEDGDGSESWIRDQYQGYTLALLKATLGPTPSKESDAFNAAFIAAFKETSCYSSWFMNKPDDALFESLPNGHPFAGTVSVVADMKFKLAQTMHNSESGRKLNQAVNTTSRAVGGAISQAKGALSNWWSSISAPVPPSPIPTSGRSTDDGEDELEFAKEVEIIEHSHIPSVPEE